MDNSRKGPDRLYVTKKVRNAIDTKIIPLNYLGLSDGVSRSELFAFAMAIGSETMPTELSNINSGGLVLEKSIDGQTEAVMYSYFIAKNATDDLDKILRKDEVFSLAQKYANTGFEVIEDYIDNKKDTDLMWELLNELDQQYQQVLNDNVNTNVLV